ncbi:MAG: cofactor-independent phosphoglycerate mutase [Methanocellales archaeon]
MKYAIIIGDGMADYPIKELNGKTPLEVASTPNMDYIAKHGKCGMARNVPDGMEPGSDVANLSILGFDPRRYYTGRGPLEAASAGIKLGKKDVAFRCNLITENNGTLLDYSAGHIKTEESRELMPFIDRALGNEKVKFYPGVSYRNLLVIRDLEYEKVQCTPPHDIIGLEIEKYFPKGKTRQAKFLTSLILKSKSILESHEINKKRRELGENQANMIWMWGQGRRPELPSFKEKFGVEGGMISAVDLLRGIAIYAGLKIINVPAITGYFDTNYRGKAEYALKALKEMDFICVHVEAPDEASHQGSAELKLKAIMDFDRYVVGGILKGIKKFSSYKILICPDHPTPLSLRTHSNEPVPFAIMSSRNEKDDVEAFNEVTAKQGGYGYIKGHELMNLMFEKC